MSWGAIFFNRLRIQCMVFSIEHQLELPDDFPAQDMVAFMAAARTVTLSPRISLAWIQLGGASNLIGWRFRSCHEDMSTYIESWKRFGSHVSFEEIYLREKALFGMFTAGVSCIETACYALYALASHPKLLALPFGENEQRNCTPTSLQKQLAKRLEAKALAVCLELLVHSKEWQQWVALRNRMSHRSNLPRHIRGAVGSKPPPAKILEFAATTSTPAFIGDHHDLRNLFTWLSGSLRNLLIEGRSFATSLSVN